MLDNFEEEKSVCYSCCCNKMVLCIFIGFICGATSMYFGMSMMAKEPNGKQSVSIQTEPTVVSNKFKVSDNPINISNKPTTTLPTTNVSNNSLKPISTHVSYNNESVSSNSPSNQTEPAVVDNSSESSKVSDKPIETN